MDINAETLKASFEKFIQDDSKPAATVDDITKLIDDGFNNYLIARRKNDFTGYVSDLVIQMKDSSKRFTSREYEIITFVLTLKLAQIQIGLIDPKLTTKQIVEIVSDKGFDENNPEHYALFGPL